MDFVFKQQAIKEALSVLMFCAPVFIFTSGSSALLERPRSIVRYFRDRLLGAQGINTERVSFKYWPIDERTWNQLVTDNLHVVMKRYLTT